MAIVGALVAGLTGVPVGWVVWSRVHDRSVAIVSGLATGATALVLAAWTYYSQVLCPAGAGCV